MSSNFVQPFAGMVLVSFVFNSPRLIPWGITETNSDQQLHEAILLWGESRRQGYRFAENEAVAEIDNPRQKMIIRRILRKRVGEGDNFRSQIIGIECYWWQDASLPVAPMIRSARKVSHGSYPSISSFNAPAP